MLAPSSGLGGGIERMAASVERAWGDGVVRCDLYRRGAQPGHPLAKVSFARRAAWLAVRARPPLVLVLHAGLLPVALAIAPLARARVALVGVGTEVWGPMSRLERELVSRCWRVLAISTFTAQQLTRRAALADGRVRVISLPVAEPFARAARERAARERRGARPTLLTVSRIVAEHRYKGHLLVAESLPLVLERCPQARWRVVGGGDDVDHLRDRCRALGVLDAVDLDGEVDEPGLLDAYVGADALVLPSVANSDASPPEGEGFGLVYAEAAAFGVPSVAARRGGGALDLVEHEVTGLTVDADPADLGHATARLLGDRALRRRLGEAARERVRARHLPEQFAAALHDALADSC
ncbi:MAG: glycosyltransferase family 4 protein [Chloroflexi bacterium]|nr:glycosyltransferase family 4 protein [Chloroflexota bacterium]